MRSFVIISLIIFIFMGHSPCAAQSSNERAVLDEIMDLKVQNGKIEEAIKAMDKRIDDLRSDIKSDIADLRGLVYVILGGIITLIGFVLWDRRTAITPVVKKAKELEQGLEEERVIMRKVLKGYALVEPRFAEVLRTAGVL
ncbi:hypothetical protein HY793_05450 [Candidatus Desantisbacteria bacterium]|nr:hypothetical protein [Candidatus Desantisbacteria bacterium]